MQPSTAVESKSDGLGRRIKKFLKKKRDGGHSSVGKAPTKPRPKQEIAAMGFQNSDGEKYIYVGDGKKIEVEVIGKFKLLLTIGFYLDLDETFVIQKTEFDFHFHFRQIWLFLFI